LASDVTSINTVTPRLSPVEYINTGSQIESNAIESSTQTITESVSTITTILPIPNPISGMIPPRGTGISDLRINIHPVEISAEAIKQVELLNSNVDLALIEAYIPIPEILELSNSITQFYP